MKDRSIHTMKIGIAGVGMVGGAMAEYLQTEGRDPILYDIHKKMGSMEELNTADIVFICVPTPYVEGEGFDLSIVEGVCEALEGSKIVVMKSTVVPGTTEKLQKQYPSHKFLFNPEFLTEHTAEQDMRYPDRQIIGYTKQSYTIAGDLLQILPLAPYEAVIPATEAEMVKYFGNTWFSIKVTFANQIHDLCEKLGLNYDSIMEAAAADKRIGRSHLQVVHKGYRGYGGKCLPKDIRALIQFADDIDVDLVLHKVAEEYNNKLMEQQGIDDPEKFSKRE
ncbi:MAG: hypothetical protein KJI69_02055 [Patescibacteria group bacterium]|nr:hypothetical protein [Patescibacteria group bacterium]